MGRRRLPQGFTVTELVVVVGIIMVLVALLTPMVQAARMRARVMNTTVELKGLAVACELYRMTYGDYPGLFRDEDIAFSHRPLNYSTYSLSSTQNLLLSLMGTFYPTAPSGIPTTTIRLQTCPYLWGSMPFPYQTAYVDLPQPSMIAPGTVAAGSSSVQVANGFWAPKNTDLATTGGGFTNSVPQRTLNGGAVDSSNSAVALPTVVDRFADPLPVLYYRKAKLPKGMLPQQLALVSNCPNPSTSNTANPSCPWADTNHPMDNSAYSTMNYSDYPWSFPNFASFYASANDEYTDAGAVNPSYGQPLVSPTGAKFTQNPGWAYSGNMGWPNWLYLSPGNSRNSSSGCALGEFVSNPGISIGGSVGFVLIAAGPKRQYGFSNAANSSKKNSDNIVVAGGP